MSNNTKPLKIVITGPENSGKTTLARQLAHHLRWPVVWEAARTELTGGQSYGEDDLRRLCQFQCHREFVAFQKSTTGLICDTNALTIFIWAQLKLGIPNVCCNESIFQPDLYILCYHDVPYEDDMQREDVGRRDMLFDLYLLTLLRWELPFVIVKGDVEQRLRYTINAIQAL